MLTTNMKKPFNIAVLRTIITDKMYFESTQQCENIIFAEQKYLTQPKPGNRRKFKNSKTLEQVSKEQIFKIYRHISHNLKQISEQKIFHFGNPYRYM